MALLGKEATTQVHPKNWPYCETSHAGLNYYQATVKNNANGPTFWSSGFSVPFGAEEGSWNKSANTYYTYVNISGHNGAMGTIVVPTVSTTGTGFYTFKITTDGVVEEFRTIGTATLGSNRRHFLGFARDSAHLTGVRENSGSGYGIYSYFHDYAGINSLVGATIRTVEDSLYYGTPVHQFNESLKVEVKCSLATGDSWYNKSGGVLYTSAPNV